jgi:DNA-directed RNA polymerase subunit L
VKRSIQIENPYKNNIQIVKLQPKQYISFNVVTSIGIEKENTIYSPVSICVYEQKSDNDFRFIMESKGQLTEKRILKVAILNLLKKLQDISDQVAETSTSKEESGEIQINKEDHTFGNLLTHGLQNHKNISFAGYNMPHPLEKRVVISYKLKSGNFVDIFKSVVKDFIELFTKIDKVLDKAI